MIKKAFTLIELLFVIVIMGILVGVGANMFHTNYLLNDTNFMALKIKETQYKAIGIDHRKFGGGEIADNRGCMQFLEDNLHVKLGGYLAGKTICFNHFGQPNEGNFSNPLTEEENLTLSYGSRSSTISLQPMTGYAIIKY